MKIHRKCLLYLLCLVSLFILSGCTKEKLLSDSPHMVSDNGIVCESKYIAYITDDSRVYIAYDDGSGEYISGFDSIVQLSGGESELAALNSDGRLMFFDVINKSSIERLPDWEEVRESFELGGNTVFNLYNLKKEMHELDDIDNIYMQYPEWFICSKNDGSTVIDGVYWDKEYYKVFLTKWSDIVKYKAVSGDVIGLKKDGTVMSNVYEERTDEELSDWKDIVDIECGFSFIGLKSDGSVLTTDHENDWKIDDWHDIIQISAAPNTIVGLSKNNTVLVTHDLDFGQSEAASWEDIIFVKASYDYVLGVKSDKTFVVTSNENSKFDFSNAPAPKNS